MRLADVVDTLLDRSVVLGYTRIGPALRQHWWPSDPAPDAMAGRTVLVTGATSGLGQAAAAGLARLGATVHVHGRDEQHLETALTQLGAEVPQAVFKGELCDLADLADVRRFAADFGERVGSLDALVHNAGTMSSTRRETADGHEVTVAVMVLGPHLLTELLRDQLASAGGAMVTFMSSGGMYGAGLRDDDPEYRSGRYSGVRAYARCKRMQVVLAQMWAERLAPVNIEVASMHPGWVDTKGVAEYLPKFRLLTLPLMRSAVQGADTMVWLVATRPLAGGSGRFWHDRRLRPTGYVRDREESPEKRRRLWDYVASVTDTPGWNPGEREPVGDIGGDGAGTKRFEFGFAARYRLAALLFGIVPATTEVRVDAEELRVRFGPWRLRTPLANIAGWEETGGFSFLKTAGPAHLSLVDRGITFATNSERAVCVRFHCPVEAIEPSGRVLHPGVTLTVADPSALIATLERQVPVQSE